MYYMFALLASVLLTAEFGFSKKYQLAEGNAPAAVLRFNAISGLVSAGIMWMFSGFRLEWSGFSFLLAAGMGLCCVGYTLLGFHVLKLGGMALYSTFLMAGGMVLPYLFGISFLGEPLTLLRTLGILAMLAAVILSNSREKRFSGKLLALCTGVFILNGIVSILSKCHQITGRYETVSSAQFVMYSGLCKCCFCSALLWGKRSLLLFAVDLCQVPPSLSALPHDHRRKRGFFCPCRASLLPGTAIKRTAFQHCSVYGRHFAVFIICERSFDHYASV